MTPAHLGLPDEDTMACEDGLVENHFYQDLRMCWTWLDFERALQLENELMDAEVGGLDLGSDEAFEEFQDNELYSMDLDPGTASTVVALCCLGCVPFTSCNGSQGHYETHPLVCCWVPGEKEWEMLVAAGAEADVHVEPLDSPGAGAIIWSLDIMSMRAFAKLLYRNCGSGS